MGEVVVGGINPVVGLSLHLTRVLVRAGSGGVDHGGILFPTTLSHTGLRDEGKVNTAAVADEAEATTGEVKADGINRVVARNVCLTRVLVRVLVRVGMTAEHGKILLPVTPSRIGHRFKGAVNAAAVVDEAEANSDGHAPARQEPRRGRVRSLYSTPCGCYNDADCPFLHE